MNPFDFDWGDPYDDWIWAQVWEAEEAERGERT